MPKQPRFLYALAFCILLLAEIAIALFVRDSFIRPYIGDVLVTALLCCLCRAISPKDIHLLPVYVFLFAAAVELSQAFDLIKLLGLEHNKILSTALGRTFSFHDLVCYAVGCMAFWAAEYAVKHRKKG